MLKQPVRCSTEVTRPVIGMLLVVVVVVVVVAGLYNCSKTEHHRIFNHLQLFFYVIMRTSCTEVDE